MIGRLLLLLLLILLLLSWAPLTSETPRWELGLGRFELGGNDSAECYFAVGQHTMVALHPKSEYCTIARQELVGKTGRLVFLVD